MSICDSAQRQDGNHTSEKCCPPTKHLNWRLKLCIFAGNGESISAIDIYTVIIDTVSGPPYELLSESPEYRAASPEITDGK